MLPISEIEGGVECEVQDSHFTATSPLGGEMEQKTLRLRTRRVSERYNSPTKPDPYDLFCQIAYGVRGHCFPAISRHWSSLFHLYTAYRRAKINTAHRAPLLQ